MTVFLCSANWVNSVQPLFLAGKQVKNPAEQVEILKQLVKIEKETGWKTSTRARELRQLWGLE